MTKKQNSTSQQQQNTKVPKVRPSHFATGKKSAGPTSSQPNDAEWAAEVVLHILKHFCSSVMFAISLLKCPLHFFISDKKHTYCDGCVM